MGEGYADLALVRLAESIQLSIRQNCDIPFRFGGDEFAVLLPETFGREAVEIAERIRARYKSCSVCETTLSLGVASAGFVTENIEYQVMTLLKVVDHQSYEVKRRGGDGVGIAKHVGISC